MMDGQSRGLERVIQWREFGCCFVLPMLGTLRTYRSRFGGVRKRVEDLGRAGYQLCFQLTVVIAYLSQD
jgi:hypothetical protein